MKSTREKVLQTLASNPKSTIVNIAKSVGINAISVRHHLTSLQAAGLIEAEEERHGVGRPRLIYSLTENGFENFPSRYYQLTNKLISQLKNSLPKEKIENIFTQMGKDFSINYKEKILSMSFEERLDFLKEIMQREGYEINWREDDGCYSIYEVSCPFYQIGKDHPQVCLFDIALIAGILDVPETQIKHQRDDQSLCMFTILR